ncbi:MAG: hypothetical protein OEM21_06300, partial [Nitrosopumilus sp.]|nr:hypothetical protein [Nitrosopumilus sp.]
MNKKFPLSIISGTVVIFLLVILLLPTSEKQGDNSSSISYVETNKNIQTQLAMHNIAMSSPLKINGLSIEKYCTFFSDESIQDTLEYCTSTELLDSDG